MSETLESIERERGFIQHQLTDLVVLTAVECIDDNGFPSPDSCDWAEARTAPSIFTLTFWRHFFEPAPVGYDRIFAFKLSSNELLYTSSEFSLDAFDWRFKTARSTVANNLGIDEITPDHGLTTFVFLSC